MLNSKLEILLDEQAYSVKKLTKIAGGSAIFKHQSACPFRAFAYFRLGIRQSLDATSMGFSPSERGTLLHRVLETVWNKIENQQNLLRYSTEELKNIIEQSVEAAFLNFIKHRTDFSQHHFIAIEKIRLTNLVNDWLELEKKRPTFSVHTVEKSAVYSFLDLEITLRADRIDQLNNGKYLLIDYKTGNPTLADWFGDRPEDPQLPLYSILSELPIEGIMFAQIQSNKKQFKGITQNEQLYIPGVYPLSKIKENNSAITWEELVKQWRIHLTKLGEQFKDGYAKVDPKDGIQTCQYCELQSLCRINEQI